MYWLHAQIPSAIKNKKVAFGIRKAQERIFAIHIIVNAALGLASQLHLPTHCLVPQDVPQPRDMIETNHAPQIATAQLRRAVRQSRA
jgi:hypothetical protein